MKWEGERSKFREVVLQYDHQTMNLKFYEITTMSYYQNNHTLIVVTFVGFIRI